MWPDATTSSTVKTASCAAAANSVLASSVVFTGCFSRYCFQPESPIFSSSSCSSASRLAASSGVSSGSSSPIVSAPPRPSRPALSDGRSASVPATSLSAGASRPSSATAIISSRASGLPRSVAAGPSPLNKPSGAFGAAIFPCSQARSCSYHSTAASFFSMMGFAAFKFRETPSVSLILPTQSFRRTCSAGMAISTWPCWNRTS
mmetsp:Transcript_20733/g.62493  ORF Transcript_20733/g.62493 Transcript_20733/m.62493 type:complete len:204 (-) Transcript_20733:726-1337(-)